MKVNVCDKCRKPLGEEFCHIPVMKSRFDHKGGWGKLVRRIGGRHLCEECAFGIAELIDGDSEITNVTKHSSYINRPAILEMHKKGKSTTEIVEALGYSESTVRRVVAAYRQEKAAPK